MNYCNNCSKTFTDEEAKKIHGTFESDYGVSDLFPTQTPYVKYVCPYCDSEDYEEARECERCGEYCLDSMIEDAYETLGLGYMCPQCYEDSMMDRYG